MGTDGILWVVKHGVVGPGPGVVAGHGEPWTDVTILHYDFRHMFLFVLPSLLSTLVTRWPERHPRRCNSSGTRARRVRRARDNDRYVLILERDRIVCVNGRLVIAQTNLHGNVRHARYGLE